MKMSRLNKMFAAAVPMLLLLISMFWPDADISAEDLTGWWEALLVVAAPILVYIVPNKE